MTLRSFTLIAALLLLCTHHAHWFGSGSVRDVWRLEGAVLAQHAENARLAERNAALALEIEDLREGSVVLEARARGELGMIAPGEVLYQFLEAPAAESDPAR